MWILQALPRRLLITLTIRTTNLLDRYKNAYRACFFVCIFYMLFPCSIASARTNSIEYQNSLIAQANILDLHNKKYWFTLLHYHNKGNEVLSYIDDLSFFLAKNGQTSPQEELEATIRGLFIEKVSDEKEHPICKYPARFKWLKNKLSIDVNKLPQVSCDNLNRILNKIQPSKVVLVFPTESLRHQASIFGHTFIRIDSEGKNPLLSYAISFSAVTQDISGVQHAYKGITGKYKGYYSLKPYFEIISDYNDIENRDLIEYQLNFTKEESINLLLHALELQNVYKHYYFVKENCSFNLLFLLDAARQNLNLVENVTSTNRFWILPYETVRLIQNKGIIHKKEYRLSLARKIKLYMNNKHKNVSRLALELVRNKIEPKSLIDLDLSQNDKSDILYLAAEMIKYEYSQMRIPQESFQNKFKDILSTKVTWNMSKNINLEEPVEERNKPSKIELGTGYDNSNYSFINIRPLYHTMNDFESNFTMGSYVNLFQLEIKTYNNYNEVYLNEVELLSLTNFKPRDIYFMPISWRTSLGAKRKQISPDEIPLIYYFSHGSGVSYNIHERGLIYILIEGELSVGDYSDETHAIGFGGVTGYLHYSNRYKLNLILEGLHSVSGSLHDEQSAKITNSFKLTKDVYVAFCFEYNKFNNIEVNDTRISIGMYF